MDARQALDLIPADALQRLVVRRVAEAYGLVAAPLPAGQPDTETRLLARTALADALKLLGRDDLTK